MKRVISVLLAVLLLLTAFGACSVKQRPEAASTATGGEEKIIHLLTDLGHNAKSVGATYDQVNAQLVMDQFLSEMGELPEGYKLEVEVMPVEEADFQSRLTRLRTEIMSGQGPDIYFLSAADALGYDAYHDSQERLFPSTEKAMDDGFFLPLDSYMDRAQFMEFEDMNPTVMGAGCTEVGRFVLPVRYTFGAVRVREPVTDTGGSWFDVVNGTDEVMASSYAVAANWLFYDIFEETLDTESKALTFDQEELYNAVSIIIERYGPYGSFDTYDPDFKWWETIDNMDIDGNIWLGEGGGEMWDPELKDSSTYLPMRNREGGVTAIVTSYLAISKDTLYPEEAFYIVDLMMSKKFQSGQKSWEAGSYHQATSSAAVFSYSKGVSVYDDFLRKYRPMNYTNYINEDMWPAYCELRDKITDARIMSNIDQELFEIYQYAWRNNLTGDELKKYVSQEYDKMTLLVGEM